MRGAGVGNQCFFAEYKDLQRERVAPRMTVRVATPHEARVELQAPADGYVYFAHVTTPWESTRYSDNYIDLMPGEARELVITDSTRVLREEDVRLGFG